MSGADRRKYLTATVLDQNLLDWSQDNLECKIESVVEIQKTGGKIYASDRNKYIVTAGVGRFYEALTQFPVISRTIGEWLTPELQFSSLELELSNADSRFNPYLPEGDFFNGWVNSTVEVKCGLAELGSSYFPIFQGVITQAAGVGRTVKSIKFAARDKNEQYNKTFPPLTLSPVDFPYIEDNYNGKLLPVIYGDFTVELTPDPAIVPAIPVNGKFIEPLTGTLSTTADSADVVGSGTSFTTQLTVGDDVTIGTFKSTVQSIADDTHLTLNDTYPTTSSGLAFGSSSTSNIQLIISQNALRMFDTTKVYLKRSSAFYLIPASDIVNVNLVDHRSFEIIQNVPGHAFIEGKTFLYQQGDEILVQVKGKDIGAAYQDNPVAQAKDILITYGGMSPSDFHSNWTAFQNKTTPAQSAIFNIKSRVWVQDEQQAVTYANSLLDQVRLEAFFDRNGLMKLNAIHFEEWDPSPLMEVNNWDVEEKSFNLAIDEKNNFNRAQGSYNRFPSRDDNARQTLVYRNQGAIDQAGGKEISKLIQFPNLYVAEDVANQVIEILRLASAMIEIASPTLTWRFLLQDLGGFVSVNVDIASTQFSRVPAMIREIGYDPNGFKLPVKLWLFSMCPFPGYNPGYAGTVGGYAADITYES